MMSKLFQGLLLVCLALGTWSVRAEEKLPNVVIVFTDDQGYQDLGVFGAEGFETPNIDRMAAEGRIQAIQEQAIAELLQ